MLNLFKGRNRFLSEVRAAFAGLLDSGRLRVADSSYSARSFGNAVVTLEDAAFRVRITRDRSVAEIEVASQLEPDKWYFLDRALRVVTGGAFAEDTHNDLRQAATLLHTHFDRLQEKFAAGAWAETKRALDQLDDAARDEWVKKFKQNEPPGNR